MTTLPPQLLHAVAERNRRIALVLGAGCSLEQPTNLALASTYALQAHGQLVLDGVLVDGDCPNPSDLSALATAVKAKTGAQAALVKCLPKREFRLAPANAGYLLAAALLREGVIDSVLTLNFDLALTNALVALSATEVSVVPGPRSSDQLGTATVIYLHRSVEQEDPELWILTVEALDSGWQDGWPEVVAQRVMATPVVVFAGLGSPAAVLTETVTRVRAALVAGEHHVFVVDPSKMTEFEAALELSPEAHVELGWCAFMTKLAARLLAEFKLDLVSAAQTLCRLHSWDGEAAHQDAVCDRFLAGGLVDVGKIRAKWLLEQQQYSPDDARRPLIADLLLGVGLVERALGLEARFRDDGVVELARDGELPICVFPASGSGTLRWSALEVLVLRQVEQMKGSSQPERVLVSGFTGPKSASPAPPENLLSGDDGDDIIQGLGRPELFSADELRANPYLLSDLVA